MIASRRLWLTADYSAIVFEGDPAAATLLAGAGCEIPDMAPYGIGLPPLPKGWDMADSTLEPETPAGYNTLSRADLVALCSDRNLNAGGSKADLIERLIAADQES